MCFFPSINIVRWETEKYYSMWNLWYTKQVNKKDE